MKLRFFSLYSVFLLLVVEHSQAMSGFYMDEVLKESNNTMGTLGNVEELIYQMIQFIEDENMSNDDVLPHYNLSENLTIRESGFPPMLEANLIPDKDKDREIYLQLNKADRLRVIEQIIENEKFNKNAIDQVKLNTLMFACEEGDNNVVKYLIDQGVNINVTDENKQTPLMFACEYGYNDVVETLLNYKSRVGNNKTNGRIKINKTNVDNCTALILASKNGHASIVNLLLQHKADVDIQDNNCMNAFMYAAINKHENIIRLFIKHYKNADMSDKQIQKKIDKANAYGNTALMYAAHKGNDKVIDLLIQYGSDINKKNAQGYTSLIIASEAGYEKVVGLLIKHNANINDSDNEGFTALMRATERGKFGTVRFLVENEADIMKKQKDDRNALQIAQEREKKEKDLAKQGTYQKIAEFLEEKMNKLSFILNKEIIEEQKLTKDTTVQNNTESSRVSSMSNLDNKDNKNVDKENQDSFMNAAQNGDDLRVEMFINDGIDVNLVNDDKQSALMFAAKNGYEKVVQLLVNNGANVDLFDKNQQTALMFASQNNHEKVVELLIQNKAKINSKDKKGKTPLMLASKNGHEKVVELLLQNKANVDLKDNEGKMPLMFASKNGHEKVVELLLQKSAKVNSTDKSGNTAIILAAQNGHEKVVKLLLQNRADIYKEDNSGRNALQIARETKQNVTESSTQQRYQRIIYLLQKLMASNDTAVRETMENNSIEKSSVVKENLTQRDEFESETILSKNTDASERNLVVEETVKPIVEQTMKQNSKDQQLFAAALEGKSRELIDLITEGVNINTVSKEGFTILHIASEKGDLEVVKYLIDNNSNINAEDRYKCTPLYYAVSNGHIDIVKYLIRNGAEVNIKNQNSWTPLMYACGIDHLDVVEYLIANDINQADINAADKDGWTSLMYACANDNIEIAEFLIQYGADIYAMNNNQLTALELGSTETQNKLNDICEELMQRSELTTDMMFEQDDELLNQIQQDQFFYLSDQFPQYRWNQNMQNIGVQYNIIDDSQAFMMNDPNEYIYPQPSMCGYSPVFAPEYCYISNLEDQNNEELSQDIENDEIHQIYDEHLKIAGLYSQLILKAKNEGEKIGAKKKAIEISKKMLQAGWSYIDVSKTTGLSIKIIKKLSSEKYQ